MPITLSERQALGLDESHLAEINESVRVHRDLMGPLAGLYDRLAVFGCALGLASGFRSFQRQLHIFNAKASGERPILDDRGQVLSPKSMSRRELLFAILRFSALPGASRHHWGTDIDVYDCAALPEGYQLQLVTSEYATDGVFHVLGRCLPGCLAEAGFTRPYRLDRGGIAPEPWHITYPPLASAYELVLTKELLADQLSQTDILLKAEILNNINDIYQRFVRVGDNENAN